MILRPYQTEIISKTVQAIRSGEKSILVVAPTGSGKTIIFAHIATGAVKKNKRVLILTHRREILYQTVDKIKAFGIHAGQIVSGKPTGKELIQVAMVGTLINRLELIQPPDLIIIDEAHHAVSNTWSKILNYFDVLKIGYTATPERLSGEGLNEIFSHMILGPHTIDLIPDSLSPPRMFCGDNIQEKSKLKITRGDYDKIEQAHKMLKKVVIGSVINHYREKLNGLPTVCFCVSVDHAKMMEREFTAAGYSSRTVHGKMNRKDRDFAINGLSTGEVQVLCSCDVISEGVDIPVIAGAVLLRRTKSLALYLQQVGRALRPYPGKTEAIILDHAGNFYEHGHPLDIRSWSLEAKKRSKRTEAKPPVSVCPKCSGIWPGLPKVCPDCGHNLQEDRDRAEGRKPPREIEGILREVMPGQDVQIIRAVTDEVLRMQLMQPGDRQRHMRYQVNRYGNCERTRGIAVALGYKRSLPYSMAIHRGRG